VPEGFFIDHVIYGVQNVDAAAKRLRREFGLGSVPGGIHLGGTSNRLIPLEPPAYIELLGISDPTKPDGAWLTTTLAGCERVLWWVLSVDDIDRSAEQRGLPLQSGEMQMTDGSSLGFRTAGMNRYPLPFFVDYDAGPEARLNHMRRLVDEADHDCVPGHFSWVELGGPPALLDGWLGDNVLPIRAADSGNPGITRAAIACDTGEIVLGPHAAS
jgi:hypothetical protein